MTAVLASCWRGEFSNYYYFATPWLDSPAQVMTLQFALHCQNEGLRRGGPNNDDNDDDTIKKILVSKQKHLPPSCVT